MCQSFLCPTLSVLHCAVLLESSRCCKFLQCWHYCQHGQNYPRKCPWKSAVRWSHISAVLRPLPLSWESELCLHICCKSIGSTRFFYFIGACIPILTVSVFIHKNRAFIMTGMVIIVLICTWAKLWKPQLAQHYVVMLPVSPAMSFSKHSQWHINNMCITLRLKLGIACSLPVSPIS